MIRRGQQRQRELRRAKKATNEQIEASNGTFEPPARAECKETKYDRPLGDDGFLQLHVSFWRHKGKTVDFVLIIQRKTWEAWENTARIDCAHGTCHVHYDDDQPAAKHLLTLDSAEDVKTAMEIALQEIEEIAAMMTARGEGQ